MIYCVMCTAYGFMEVEADSEEEAIDIAKDADMKDFSWSNLDCFDIVDER